MKPSWQGPGVLNPDPVEAIALIWDGTKWIQAIEKELA